MNWRLQLIRFYCPALLKKAKLAELFNLTALAFQQECPNFTGLSVKDSLLQYALFTKKAAQAALRNSDNLPSIKERLFQNAYQLGQKIRKELHLRTFDDVLLASKILYRILGIDFQSDEKGEVIIKRCFFSQFYSSQICQLISALDQGVVAGLSDGGIFAFSQRITEGKDCCKAKITFGENRK